MREIKDWQADWRRVEWSGQKCRMAHINLMVYRRAHCRGTASARGTVPTTERLLRRTCTRVHSWRAHAILFGYDMTTEQNKAHTGM